MEDLYGAVGPPYWGATWIVACGPSLREFDLGLLRDKQVLAVNEAALSVCHAALRPLRAPAVFSLDNCWIRRRRPFLEQHAGEKFLALPLETWPDCAGIAGATYLRWSHADGLSDDLTTICTGCNSGYGALNLAYLKRAPEIWLAGFDMDPNDDEKFKHWAPLFRNTAAQLEKRGVTVVNANPRSHVDAFARVGLCG